MSLTMSSREIAELCGKPHQQVCLDIEKLDAHYAKLGLPKIERSNYTQGNDGIEQREYNLSHKQTLDLVTGYDFHMRIKVKARLMELVQAAESAVYNEVQRLQRERREAVELLEELNNAVQLHHKAEEAIQKAFARLEDKYPDAVKVLDKINAGDKKAELAYWKEWFDDVVNAQTPPLS